MVTWRMAGTIGALAALAACSEGGPSEQSLADTYNADLANLRALNDEFASRNNSAFDVMPTSGSATYEGQAGIILDRGVDLSMVGDATLTADFGRGTLSGEADSFIGTEGGIGAERFDGSLVLSDGRIGLDVPNDATGRLAGTLTGDDTVVVIDAFMVGKFVGNDGGPVGVRLEGAGGTALVDGIPASGGIGLLVER